MVSSRLCFLRIELWPLDEERLRLRKGGGENTRVDERNKERERDDKVGVREKLKVG